MSTTDHAPDQTATNTLLSQVDVRDGDLTDHVDSRLAEHRAVGDVGASIPLPATLARPGTPTSRRSTAVAYVLLLLFGGFGAHDFYLRRVSYGLTYIAANVGGPILVLVGVLLGTLSVSGELVGLPLVLVGVVAVAAAQAWLLVDLFALPGLVRRANARGLAVE